MGIKTNKEEKRIFRHSRIRKKIFGTKERPRMCVHRSLKNFHVQIIDDVDGKVIFGLSTLNKSFKNEFNSGGNKDAATNLGLIFAKEVQKKGIKKVTFDRGGFFYHGRVKAFADAARKAGMEF